MEKLSIKRRLLDSAKILVLVFIANITILTCQFFILNNLSIIQKADTNSLFKQISDNLDPLKISYKHIEDNKIDSNVIIVNIGVLSRKEIAQQVNIINSFDPKVIAIDVFFRNAKDESGDSLLENSLSKISNLVLVSGLKHNHDSVSIEKSNQRFTKYAYSAFSNIIQYDNCTYQEIEPYVQINGEKVLSFSSKIVQIYNPKAYSRLLKRNNKTEIIRYLGNSEKFIVIDLNDSLLTALLTKNNIVKNRIVLFGIADIDFRGNIKTNEDVFHTTLSKTNAPDMYGVVLQANIISMILNNSFINEPSAILNILLLLVICYLNILILTIIHTKLSNLYTSISIVYFFFFLVLYPFLALSVLYNFNYSYNPDLLITHLIITIPIVELFYYIKSKYRFRLF
jgi:CHASE2 domain-containing sensor protein